MTCETDADEGLRSVGNLDAVRSACRREAGDRFVDGVEIDDQQRRTEGPRELLRRNAELAQGQN
jgi:hypothetical protein